MCAACFTPEYRDFTDLDKFGYFWLWHYYKKVLYVELLAPVTERDGELLLHFKIQVLNNQPFLLEDTPADLLTNKFQILAKDITLPNFEASQYILVYLDFHQKLVNNQTFCIGLAGLLFEFVKSRYKIFHK